MVKAHLAILLIGLGANQALTSDDDRDRHWAEGVYFPPVTTSSSRQNYSPSIESKPARQIRRKRWSSENYYGAVSQDHTPQSLGYPVEGYDPYRPSDVRVNNPLPAGSSEYVPKNYSLGVSKEYDEDRNGYRLNGFSSGENHYRHEYRSELNAYTGRHHGDQRQGSYYETEHYPVVSDRLNGAYGYRDVLRGYSDTISLNRSQSLGQPYYDSLLNDIPYNPDWNPSLLFPESRNLQNPWEFLWPLSNLDLPNYPLW